MKILPLPTSSISKGLLSVEQRLAEIEKQLEVVRRNFQEMGTRSIDGRNVRDSSVQSRHLADDSLGLVGSVVALRFGDAAAAGTVQKSARIDHKHAIDPILILTRSDPAQLTGNVNDWALDTAKSLFFISSDAPRNVTGIANTSKGWFLWLVNSGTNNIVLQHQNAGSLAANRIITNTGLDVTLAADGTAMLVYDTTAARFRMF